ncbi:hypothetical protein EPA93_29790 [Ktedonosporobacter rubrisoli]|uniref:Baseplate protein J-like barrel domain-containing protein n=1 Tax=Ktedonosporobacter rubrisoli TaxID=2509675 RepID=A0A4P6JWA0_KTERU|nr:baseplate J/gp47 family protein [Ktedonosporobacter rubrisoli]QBD79949.1 hypothetical protein EPA93_29790 [Ktedonosporobacter rubrisoli]
MSDEQTIYISPEDDLTNVRERLEGIPSRHITLVIPTQTQLRSHVAWKLLHARAREMGKEIVIVSSDPHIRSVAQAVKFRVAHSLESSPTSRSRPAGRSGRSGTGRARGAGSSPSRPVNRGPGSTRSSARPRSVNREQQWYSPTIEESRQEPKSEIPHSDEMVTGGLEHSAFDEPAFKSYNPAYDFRIETTPPIRPLSPEQIDEEPDLLLEDFNRAQDIRQAALQGSKPGVEEINSQPERQEEQQSAHKSPSPFEITDDPFAFMEDRQPPPKGNEQRGAVSLEEGDTGVFPVQHVSELPTEVSDGEIEDQGDQGDFVIDPKKPLAARAWVEPSIEEAEEEPDILPPQRTFGVRSRRSRTGGLPYQPRQDLESEDDLPPVGGSSSAIPGPPLTAQPPAASPERTRERAAQAPAARGRPPALSRPAPRQSRPLSGASRAGASRASRANARRRSNSGYIFVLVCIFVILLIGVLAYFLPSAQVSVALAARVYAHDVSLNVVPSTQQNAGPGTVPAETLSKDFTANGQAKATGSTKIGTASASGNVTFTNNGSNPVEIPTGVVVSTTGANAISFVTTADAVVPPSASNVGNTIQIPVQAQKQGDAGNVVAGSITTLADESLNMIAKVNNVTTADLKLKVTNASAMQGGGVGNATTVTAKDLDEAKKMLRSQVQDAIQAWTKQQQNAGDVQVNLTETDTLVNAPADGQVVNDGSFPIQLKASINLLVVRKDALQRASMAQLNSDMQQDKNFAGFMLINDAQHPVVIKQDKIKITGEANALKLAFPASGTAAQNISKKQVQDLIAGKSIKDARTILSGTPGVQGADIQVSPGFVSWVPFWTEHIDVKFVAGSGPVTK